MGRLPISHLGKLIKEEIYKAKYGFHREYVESAVLFKTYSSDEMIDDEEKNFLLRIPIAITENDEIWKIYVLNSQAYKLINNNNRIYILEAQLEYAKDKLLFLDFMVVHLKLFVSRLSDAEKEKVEQCLAWLDTKKGELFGISNHSEEQEFSEDILNSSNLIKVNLYTDESRKQFRVKLIRLIDFLSTGTVTERKNKRKKLNLISLSDNAFINLLRNFQFFDKKGLNTQISDTRGFLTPKEMEKYNLDSADPFPKYMQEALERYFNEDAYYTEH